jgi:methyl-accepting chemotaxis protein
MTRISILVSVLLFLMLFIALVGHSANRDMERSMEKIHTKYTRLAMDYLVVNIRTVMNRYLVMSMMDTFVEAELADLAQTVMKNRNEVAKLISGLKEEDLTPEELEVHRRLLVIGPQYRKLQDEAIAFAKTGAPRDKMKIRLSRQGDITESENEYEKNLQLLAKMMMAEGEKENTSAFVRAAGGEKQLVILSLIALLLGLVLTVALSRTITKPLREIQESVNAFAGGNLDSRFPERGRDEIAVMGKTLQEMAEKLRNVIVAIRSAGARILSTSQNFAALAQESNASVEEFRSSVDEMGNNLEKLAVIGDEVNSSVSEVATGAQATAEKGTDIAGRVEKAMEAGENGRRAVQRVVSDMSSLAENASNTAKSVQQLSDRTRKIQDFVAQIGAIADQTNLLALNAAIEAARAGEAGRGFAVVAEEVRKLAEESNIAAQNIEGLAGAIMGELDTVVGTSLENAQASEGAKTLSGETQKLLDDMLSYLKEIADATQDLAAVSQEQAASSEEIAEAVHRIASMVSSSAALGDNIRDGAGDVAKAAEHVAAGSEDLSKLAGDLEKLLRFFRMENHHSASAAALSPAAR